MAQSKQLKIVSFNMHGFNQGRETVDNLVSSIHPDIFLFQEHWLTPANLNKFDKFFKNYFTFGISAMTDSVCAGVLRGRPFGGVICMINNDLRKYTETISCSDRMSIIKVYDKIIINIYMPCIGTADRLLICDEIIVDLLSWIQQFPMCECIIAGDFNTNLDSNDVVSIRINEFIQKNSFLRCDILFQKDNIATYVNGALHHQSTIDYILTSSGDCISDFDILDPDINFSDHLPLIATCECSSPNNAYNENGSNVPSSKLPAYYRWDRADLLSYYTYTGQWLQPVLENIENIEKLDCDDIIALIDSSYNDTVSVLIYAANTYVPQHKKSFYKFWWDEELDLMKDESIESNKLWKAAGKPRSGPIFDKRQSCRLRYRKRIKEGEKSSLSVYTNELHDSLMQKNGPAFWKCWRSKFETGKKCDEVDGCVDDTVIADKLASHFNNSYSFNNEQRANKLHEEYTSMRAGYLGLPLTKEYLFDVELVSNVIQKLKRGKSAGLDGLCAEHLINSHPIVSCILYKLFNLMLRCGYVPSAFGQSYTVPIPKIDDCRTKSLSVDDFRGIAISAVISKVFEYCVLDRFNSYLTSVDNQFGFKKGLSCSHAIFTVRNLVERFNAGGSTVNLCAIDLSKAFDKVNHCALLIKLMQRNVPLELLHVFEEWFNNCSTCVKWKTTMSNFFKIEYGVRQGSVLSPHLFALYLNDIVKRLNKNQRLFIILYADDILLLAPSLSELQILFNLCELELTSLDMCINVKKSCCMRIGSRFDSNCASINSINGTSLPWVTEMRYLGVFLVSSNRFKCSLDHAKRSFYRSANSLIGRVANSATEDVMLHLVNSKCFPLLLYGLEACPLNKSDHNSLNFTAMRFFMKIFHSSNSDLINECMFFFGVDSVSVTLKKRTAKFVARYVSSENKICQLVSKYINQ
jgi:Reverse transcriptase (RNA-dependent DNA polymerase)